MEKKTKKSAWLWILLCLPMVFIVYYVVTLSGTDIDVESVSEVAVVAPDGEGFSFTEKEDVSLYVDMYLDASPLAEPVRDVKEEEAFAVTVVRAEGNVSFTLYPELNTSGCFLKKTDGTFASVLSDHARTLLQREEYVSVYTDAGYSLPSLYFTSGTEKTTVLPKDYVWEYKDIAGNKVAYTQAEKASTQQRFNYDFKVIDNPIDFSVDADSCIITFTDSDGTKLAEKDFASLYRTSDTVLTVLIEAEWGHGNRGQGGSAVYEFEVFYDVHPELINPPVAADAGRIVYFTFRHLSADEKLVIETELVTAEPSIVYDEDNDYAYVALPLSIKNAEGDYPVTFTIGEIEESTTLSVSGANTALNRARMDTELYITSKTPESIAAYEALMAEWQANGGEAMIEPGSRFGKPTENSVLYNYGTYMSVNDDVPYFHLESIDYELSEGDSVKASDRGIIIYMGEDAVKGKMIIIDHGYGILSHYYNLGDFSPTKAVGDTVNEGEIIGIGGVSGMTYKDGEQALPMLRFAISVNGVFVDPNQFFEDGFDI